MPYQAVVAGRPLDILSARDSIEALIAGEADPRRLAELARMLLDQIDTLSAQINTLTTRFSGLLVAAEPGEQRRRRELDR